MAPPLGGSEVESVCYKFPDSVVTLRDARALPACHCDVKWPLTFRDPFHLYHVQTCLDYVFKFLFIFKFGSFARDQFFSPIPNETLQIEYLRNKTPVVVVMVVVVEAKVHSYALVEAHESDSRRFIGKGDI